MSKSWEGTAFTVKDARRLPIMIDSRIVNSNKTGALDIAIESYLVQQDVYPNECSDELVLEISKRFKVNEEQVRNSLKVILDVLEEGK